MSRPRVTKGERRRLLSVGACGRLTKQQGVPMTFKYLVARTSRMPLAPTIRMLENLG